MESQRTSRLKVYKYRWLVLILYGISVVHSFMQVSEYTMIASLMQKYYEDKYFSLEANFLIFPFVYIILFVPVSILIEKFNMKVNMMVGVFLTFCGIMVNIGDFGKFYILMVSQVICAVGQVFLLSLPTKITSLWFGPNEVSKACGLALSGMQIVELGNVCPYRITSAASQKFFVPGEKGSFKTSPKVWRIWRSLRKEITSFLLGMLVPLSFVSNEHDIYDGNLFHMIKYNVLIAIVNTVLVPIFFDQRPKLVPSLSQRQLPARSTYSGNLKCLLDNRNCVMLLLSFGLFNSVWNSFLILHNTAFTDFFPGGGYDIGRMTFIALFSGCIGCVVFGFLLDTTHQFRKISIVVMLASSLFYVVLLYFLTAQSLTGIYVSVSLYGFFAGSGLVISLEYVVEETYPISELITCPLMNATICFFTIIETLIAKQLATRISDFTISLGGLGLYLAGTVIIMYTDMNLRRRKANLS